MPRYKIVNNVRSQCTVEEEAQLDSMAETWAINKAARKEVETKIANDKASGNQKLKDLGLTDDEITAITKG